MDKKGTNYQLCCSRPTCSGDEKIVQIKRRSTKALFTSLYCTDRTETSILPVHGVAGQRSAAETAPVEQQKSVCSSTPFSAGLHGLTGTNLGSV